MRPLSVPCPVQSSGFAALCRSVIALVGTGLVGFGLTGNVSAQISQPGAATISSFAAPWEVTFQKIKEAMESRLGGLAIEQTRRVRHVDGTTGTVTFPGTLERLSFKPALTSGTSHVGFKFRLQFVGLEGKTLSPKERAELEATFNRQAAFRFRFQGFRVANAAQAAKVYDLVFLAYGRRTIKEGQRIVYRMAVLPKKGDRSSWLLELDMQTGYPLYVGQYSRPDGGRQQLTGELIVSSLRTEMRFPLKTNWWAPTLTIKRASTELSALKTALQSSKTYLATRPTVPMDYRSMRYEVHTDPYKGDTQAVLVYSDGVDHIFVRQRNVAVAARSADDSISYLDQDGVTQCLFSHKGVEFLVVGRTDARTIRDISAQMFYSAIDRLK